MEAWIAEKRVRLTRTLASSTEMTEGTRLLVLALELLVDETVVKSPHHPSGCRRRWP